MYSQFSIAATVEYVGFGGAKQVQTKTRSLAWLPVTTHWTRRMTYPEHTNRPLYPVHIISGDVILHQRTLGPIQSPIYGIHQCDDRTAALYDPSEHTEG